MWSQGQASRQDSIFPMSSPPKTEGLPAPVNVDSSSLMAVGEVIISSSSISKLPVKRPYHYLESEPLDYNTEYLLDLEELDDLIPEPDPRPVAAPPVREAGLPEISDTEKRKIRKREIDRNFRERKKRKNQEVENNLGKSEMENVKLKVLLAKEEEVNAQLSAALEFARIDVAKMEKNVAQFKIYEDKREEAIPRLLKLIEEDVSCKISKEDLWVQFCNPINGMQAFENYWEESMKNKNGMRAIVETLLLLPK